MEDKNYIPPETADGDVENENNEAVHSDSPERFVTSEDKTRNHLQVHSSVTEKLSDKRNINSLINDEDIPRTEEKVGHKRKTKSSPEPDVVSETETPDITAVSDGSAIPEQNIKLTKSEKEIKSVERKNIKTKRKLKLARDKVPRHHVFHIRYKFNENKNKYRYAVTLENEVKKLNQSEGIAVDAVKHTAKAVPKAIANKIHSEISKYEDENPTLKAAHMVEKAGESALRFGVKTAHQKIQEHPYTKVSKLKMESERLDSKLSYSKLMAEQKMNDKKQNAIMQKQAVKKAQQKSNQQKQAIKANRTAKRIADATERAAGRIIEAIAHSKAAIIVVIALLVLICMINIFAGSIFSSLSDTTKEVVSSSFTSSESDIRQAEDYLKWRENGTADFVNNIRDIYIGWDEYNISMDSLYHDPYKLISYLTARYTNFKYDNRTRELIDEIFDELYKVEIEDITELRTRQEMRHDSDGNEYEVTVTYYYYILNVRVTAKDWDSVVRPKLQADGTEDIYDLLYSKKGNRPGLF